MMPRETRRQTPASSAEWLTNAPFGTTKALSNMSLALLLSSALVDRQSSLRAWLSHPAASTSRGLVNQQAEGRACGHSRTPASRLGNRDRSSSSAIRQLKSPVTASKCLLSSSPGGTPLMYFSTLYSRLTTAKSIEQAKISW